MSYADFQARCLAVLKKAGGGEIEFLDDGGMYIAMLPDDVKIVGNSICSSVKVCWGSGHTAITRI